MAICKYCKKEMTGSDSCVKLMIIIAGKNYAPIKYGDEPSDWSRGGKYRCHDCNITAGGYHHPGCDVERCPKCKGQLIGCNCDISEGE